MIRLFCVAELCVERAWILLLWPLAVAALAVILFTTWVRFDAKTEKAAWKQRTKPLRWILLITRSLALAALLLTLAYPFTTTLQETRGDEVIKLLVDSSQSMDIYDEGTVAEVKQELERLFPVSVVSIASGRRSALGDETIKRIEGDDNLLLITDGQNNAGKALRDAGLYARLTESRLFALELEPDKNDAQVAITGPGETIEGTANLFTIDVTYTGAQPSFVLQVFVDDQLIYSGQSVMHHELTRSFGEGYHTLRAQIQLTDHFAENNVYYKSIKTVERPRVLFVNKGSSPILDGLEDIYDLSVERTLPSNLDGYKAIVLNDIPYTDLRGREDALTGFLLDGNGLVVIGGPDSYDNGAYEETVFEGLLPVRIGQGKIISPLTHNIIIVLDVSESFADFSYKKGGDETALDLGKGMAIKMVEGFRDNINVGLVAFASLGQLVQEPAPLSDIRETLVHKITTLGRGQGTQIDQGLLVAELALEQSKGTKNVILISDGKMGHILEPHAPKLVAERMAAKGITIYTVGLPSALYDVDVNRYFMQLLASIGNGAYFEPTEYQFLNVFFGKPEAKEQIFNGSSNLAIIDKDHFITRDLDLNARVTGVNFVVPKLGARSLVFTGDGNPVVSSWNFGLGRVVTLATDDGSQWAASLTTSRNSQLLTRIINYGVGNPERDKETYLVAQDGFLGEGSDLYVKSSRYPVSTDVTFTKEGEDLYKGVFNAPAPGFYSFFDGIVAVNGPRELFGLGQADELKETVEISGGAMLSLEDGLTEELASLTTRIEEARQDLMLYPLALALVLYLFEIIIRKIYEQRSARAKL